MENQNTTFEITRCLCSGCGRDLTGGQPCLSCGEIARLRRREKGREWALLALALVAMAALLRPQPHTALVVAAPVAAAPVDAAPVDAAPAAWVVSATTNSVSAGQWLDTGLQIPAGGSISIQAHGQWNGWPSHYSDMGPDGRPREGFYDVICRTANWGALIGRIGSGPYFAVGSRATISSEQGGELVLGMNDDYESGGTNDNTGSLQVTIQGVASRAGSDHAVPFPTQE